VKRIPKPVDGSFGPVTLYRQDVEHIADELGSETLDCQRGDLVFDSIDEIQTNLGSVIREIEIRTVPRGPPVRIGQTFNTIVAADEQTSRLLDFLRSNRRYVVGQPASQMAIAFIAAAIVFAATIVGQTVGVIKRPTLGLILAAIIPTAYRLVPIGSLVYLRRRHEHQSFLQRHEENIVRGVIGLVSGQMGVAFGYWLKGGKP
jgi:hypothetical protein